MEEKDQDSLTPRKRSSKKTIQPKSANAKKGKFSDEPVPYKHTLAAAFKEAAKKKVSSFFVKQIQGNL